MNDLSNVSFWVDEVKKCNVNLKLNLTKIKLKINEMKFSSGTVDARFSRPKIPCGRMRRVYLSLDSAKRTKYISHDVNSLKVNRTGGKFVETLSLGRSFQLHIMCMPKCSVIIFLHENAAATVFGWKQEQQ